MSKEIYVKWCENCINDITDYRNPHYFDNIIRRPDDDTAAEPSCEITYESNCECSKCGAHIFLNDVYYRLCSRKINW